MSMLSRFTSKLRERAKVLMQRHWSDRPDRPDGLEDALMMDDAANTIDRLRYMNNDLARKNYKLRDLARGLIYCNDGHHCDHTCPWYHVDADGGTMLCYVEDLKNELRIEVE